MAFSNINETFEWDVETTILLINLFKDNESLYNNSHVDYTNNDIRQNAIAKIANEIDEKSGKVCSVIDVREKISSLCSQYIAEKQKIIKSNSASDEYTSTKYWFPLLQFLEPYTNQDLSQSNLDRAPPNEPITDLPLIKNKEQVPPKPPPRRKKLAPFDNMSMTNFNINPQISNVPCNLAAELYPHVTTFCSFLKSELICIRETGGEEFFKKAKRKLQVALFEVWDEMENFNEDME